MNSKPPPMSNPVLLLDRDGVINREVGYVWEPERFELQAAGIELAVWAMRQGYRVGIVTNQGGIAKGLYNESDVRVLHRLVDRAFLAAGVAPPLIFYCPHHQLHHRCFCRKPERLWMERALARLGGDPARAWMVGDNERDLIPAKALGMQTVFIGNEPPAAADVHIPDLQNGLLQLYRLLSID